MTLKINRRLHLVVPIQQGDRTLYAHAAPIAKETFDAYYLILAQAFAELYKKKLGVLAAPKVAARLLIDLAEKEGVGDDVRTGLMDEMRRLTNIFAPSDKGWVMMPLVDAQSNNVIDLEDAAEVENIAAFFTLAWHMHRKAEREVILASAAEIWTAQLSSLSCTEYLSFLQTSMTAEGSISKTA